MRPPPGPSCLQGEYCQSLRLLSGVDLVDQLTMDLGLPVVPEEKTIQIGWLKSPRKKGIVAGFLVPSFMKFDQLRTVGPGA